jgi:hypothetical protein
MLLGACGQERCEELIAVRCNASVLHALDEPASLAEALERGGLEQILQHPLHLHRGTCCADDVTRLGTTCHAAHAVVKAHAASADSAPGRHFSIAFKPALPWGT